jgi:hypothetical protein
VVVQKTPAQGGAVVKQSLDTSRHEDTLRASDVDTPDKLATQLNRLQRLAGNNTRGSRTLPFNGGTYWPSQSLIAGQNNQFAHGINGPAAFIAARVRPSAGTSPIIVEVGQTADGRIQLATTANCLADLFFYPQPGETNIGPSTKLAGPFTPVVTPAQAAGGGASVGLAANRPVATGSGKLYFCTDIPVMYVDDPTLKAWVQFNQVYMPAGPVATSYTLSGSLGLTQYADSILAGVPDQSANINSCALAAGSLPQTSPWTVTLKAALSLPPSSFPGFGVCVGNGTTSGTSEIWQLHVFANGGTSLELEAATATVGGAFITSIFSVNGLVQSYITQFGCIHFRLLNDGNLLHFQYGDSHTWLDHCTIATPSGLTEYGFCAGSGSSSNARIAATVFENLLGTLTVPQATITSATAPGTGTVFTTTAAHGLHTGDWVTIRGVTGMAGVNTAGAGNGMASVQPVSVLSPTTFSLPNVTTSGAYVSGGTVTCVSR